MAVNGFDRLYEAARALGEETRFRIYRQLCASTNPASVSELAESFSLHPNAIRPHLARLEQAGLVVSHTARSSGAGRPRRLYRPSPEPLEFSHPPRSMRPLVGMLAEAVGSLPAERGTLMEFGRAWGRTWARDRQPDGAPARSRRTRAEVLSSHLAEWGWQPVVGSEAGDIRVATGRCLFRDVTENANGRCCALEEGLLRGIVESVAPASGRVSRTGECRLEATV